MNILVTVYYDPDNEKFKMVPDGDAEEYVKGFIKDAIGAGDTCQLDTCQESVVDWVRVWITRKLINHKQVEFIFKDNIMFSDKYGKLDWWPKGFCDYRDKQLEYLLKGFFDGAEK